MSVFVILTPGFPRDEADTTCLPAFQQFALSVQKLYPACQLLVLSFQYPFERREYTWHGLRVIALGGRNQPGICRAFIWLQAYRILKKLQKQEGISGLLSLWLTECALIGKQFSKRNGLKHFMWLIGQDARKTNSYIPRIRPKGSEIIAMSDFLKEDFFKNHGELPFMIAENGIVTSSFPPFNKGKRSIDVLGVGSLIPLKNYRLFIELIATLKEKFPGIQAVLAGAGEEEAELKALAKTLQLDDNLRFAGLQLHAKVFELMNNSKVFLHTSTYEGNSTVLMEALYSGCHTISTQPLSNRAVKNLSVLQNKEALLAALIYHFEQKQITYESVVFNTMDASAKKIMELYGY